LKPHWIALGGLVALGLLYFAFLMTRGTGSVPYRDVLLANYSLVDGVRVAIYYLAGLTLEIGVFPVSAFIILLGLALRAPGVSRGTRAFVAVALPTLLWFLLEIGLFGSRFASSFPVERYSFYLEPLFLIGLVAWLHQGLPRPRVLTALAVLVPVGLVVWFPLSKFIQDSPLYSSFGLYYFFNLVTRLGTSAGHIELLASIGAVLAGLLFVFIPRRLGPIALALPLAIFFVAVSRSAFISLKTYGFFARYETGLGRDSSWIEEAVGRNQPVTLLYTDGGADKFVTSQALMQAEFWNRNVNAVANIGSKELCPLPERDGRFDANTGHIEPAAGKGNLLGPVVVTSGALGLAGQRVASHPPFVAYRVRGPAHVKSQAEGFYADGWTGGTASFKEFEAAPPGSRLLVGVSRAAWLGPDKPGTVTIRVRALTGRVLATRRWVVHSGTARTFRLPGPRVPYSVELRVKPTFVPADYGLADTRSLGARFSISVAPQRARLTKAQ